MPHVPTTEGELDHPPTAHRVITLIAVVLPPLGILAVIGTLWGVAVKPIDLVLFALFYVVPGLGITVGFHRYFTQRSFETGLSASGSPTIANTTPTPTSRATRTPRTSAAVSA